MFEVNLMGDKYKVNACKTKYLVDGSLAVVLTRKKENFADLTVNVGLEPTNKNCAFVDTNNNKWAEAFLKDNKIVKQYMLEKFEVMDYSKFYDYLVEICENLDIPTPVLIKTHLFNYAKYNNVRFGESDFVESIDFDKLVLENAFL